MASITPSSRATLRTLRNVTETRLRVAGLSSGRSLATWVMNVHVVTGLELTDVARAEVAHEPPGGGVQARPRGLDVVRVPLARLDEALPLLEEAGRVALEGELARHLPLSPHEVDGELLGSLPGVDARRLLGRPRDVPVVPAVADARVEEGAREHPVYRDAWGHLDDVPVDGVPAVLVPGGQGRDLENLDGNPDRTTLSGRGKSVKLKGQTMTQPIDIAVMSRNS